MSRILITGSVRGIGHAAARTLAERGHQIAVHSRRDAEEAAAAVASLSGRGHASVVGDLSTSAGARQVVSDAVAGLGGLDVLVSNAAVHHTSAPTSPFEEWMSSWRQTLDVNVLAPAALAWALVDHLTHRPEGPAGGRLVGVGSRGAYRGEPDAAAYGASKAALHAFIQSMAIALAPQGIVATAVAPGFTATAFADSVLAGPQGSAVRAQSPFGRVAEPEEVGEVIAWLATDAPAWVSGTVVDVNGASYLR